MNRVGQQKQRQAGFSYVEALAAAVIMAVLLTAGMRLSGNLARSQHATLDKDSANRLILLMIQEMKSQAYADPEQPGNFGRESGESAITRADLDDLDDYDNWQEQPPKDSSGQELTQYADFTRQVEVRYAAANDFTQTVTADEGFKAVNITIRSGEHIIVQSEYIFADVKWISN